MVVQERRRLYRESITACLRRFLDGVQVLDGVPDPVPLLEVADRLTLAHAVIEADDVPWDVSQLASALRQRHPDVRVIGLTTAARPSPCSGVMLLPRSASPEQLAELVQPGHERTEPFVLTAASSNGNRVLNSQQLRVLTLLGLGLTAADVANRLGMSERGVNKSKAAIFAKLGVQSQSQAVATALAMGLLGPAARP